MTTRKHITTHIDPAAAIALSPRVFLGFETSALFWRAVKERRLPWPTPLEIESLPRNCITTFQGLARVDLSPLGVQLTREGLVASHHFERLTVTNSSSGTVTFREQIVPTGIAITPGTTLPIHIMASHQAQRGSCRCIKPRLVSGTLPPHSLYAISDEIAVASPELTLVQLARNLRMLPCIELACEWCGSYALGPATIDCVYETVPITDKTRITELIQRHPAPHGSRSVAKMMKWIAEGLASPRETVVFLMLSLPSRLGGFALPIPYVNQQIPLVGTDFANLTKYLFFVADLLWPWAKLILEYDGFEDHEVTSRQIAADKERRSILAAMGYTVIVITRHDVENLSRLQRKVRQIAIALGVTLDEAEADMTARKALFSWLFDSMHDHVPFGFGYR